MAKRLVEAADRYDSLIVLEDLRGLKTRASERGERLAWLFTHFAYRKLHGYVEYKASWRGLRTIYVPARGTSRTSPLGPVKQVSYRFVELPSGTITTRDLVAAWNLAHRGLKRMRGSRGSRGAPMAGAVRG